MRYDHDKVRASNRLRAKTNLEKTITEALNAGLHYEDICEVVAKTINKVAEEKKS